MVEMLSFGTSEGVGLGWKEGGLGGGFIFFNVFIPNLRETIQFYSYFSKGLVQPPTRVEGFFLSGWPEW